MSDILLITGYFSYKCSIVDSIFSLITYSPFYTGKQLTDTSAYNKDQDKIEILNMVNLCGFLPYKRMLPHLCGRIIYYYLISIFILLQSLRPGPNIVCNNQLNRARVGVFPCSMSAISISQRKYKRPSNMDHVLGVWL